jgi:hypothetical protein
MTWGMEILPFVTHGEFIFLHLAAHGKKYNPYFSSDEDYLNPAYFFVKIGQVMKYFTVMRFRNFLF